MEKLADSLLQLRNEYHDFLLTLPDNSDNRSLFFGHSDKILKHKSTVQQKNLNNFLQDKKLQHNPEKNIFNYSSYVLSEPKNSLLLKGLNFSIPPENLNHALISYSTLSYFAES